MCGSIYEGRNDFIWLRWHRFLFLSLSPSQWLKCCPAPLTQSGGCKFKLAHLISLCLSSNSHLQLMSPSLSHRPAVLAESVLLDQSSVVFRLFQHSYIIPNPGIHCRHGPDSHLKCLNKDLEHFQCSFSPLVCSYWTRHSMCSSAISGWVHILIVFLALSIANIYIAFTLQLVMCMGLYYIFNVLPFLIQGHFNTVTF